MNKRFIIPFFLIVSALGVFVFRNSLAPKQMVSADVTSAGDEEQREPIHGKPIGNKDVTLSKTNLEIKGKVFLKQFPGKWKFTYNDQGVPHTITGDQIPLKSISAKEALNVARKVAQSLGFDGEQISDRVLEPSQTKYGKNFKFQQELSGVLVYDASLSFYVSKETSSISIIDNQLKDIKNPNLTKKYTLDEAVEIVLQSKDGFRLQEPPGPMIYVSEGKSELVYRVAISKESDDLEVLISTSSGEILSERSLRVY